MIDYIGAPEEIRTPDPQIRSRTGEIESKGLSCKPAENQTIIDQRVRRSCANPQSGPPNLQNDSAADAGHVDGAKRNSKRIDDRVYARGGNNPQAEKRIVVASWPRNAREQIEVALDQYQDCRTIDLRTWFTSPDGSQRPTRSGLSLSVRHLPALADALAKALVRAREMGLVGDGGRE